jgi:hypothetical protein
MTARVRRDGFLGIGRSTTTQLQLCGYADQWIG